MNTDKQVIYKTLEIYFDSYQISELLQKQTGFSKSQLFLCSQVPNIDNNWLEKIKKLGEKKYPFEYIINKAEFFGLEFYVDDRVLIPRNDTEIMVEKCISIINNSKGKSIYIDIGTGSSCIPIAVLKNINLNNINASYVIDISSDALKVSKKNISLHNLSDTIIQLEGSLLEPIINKLNINSELIITANLPYIKDLDHNNMDNQTIIYEPDLALYGGKNTGFELYEELIQQAIKIKSDKNISKITLFIEIGFDQEIYSQEYLKQLGLEYKLFKDNGGITRCISINI